MEKTVSWTKTVSYKNFSDSKDVIYILICKTWVRIVIFIFYLGQTHDFKHRIAKHKSDVKHPHNSTCRICSEYLEDCNQAAWYFQIVLFYFETNTAHREYKEKRYILRWKAPSNLNKTSMVIKLINKILIAKFVFCIAMFINKLHIVILFRAGK